MEKQEMKELLDEAFRQNNRIIQDFVKQEVSASEKRILEGVGEMIDGGINSQLNDHETRITKLEKQYVG